MQDLTTSSSSLGRLISTLLAYVRELGQFIWFVYDIIFRILTWQFFPRELFSHLGTVVFRCLIPVCACIAPVGLVLALQGGHVFAVFGAERLLSFLVGQAMFREVGPVLTAVMLAAQGGASFTAELGAMRVQQQIDATEVMGVDPLSFHVTPRVLALGLAAPLLNITGCVSGIVAAYVYAIYFCGHDSGAFIYSLFTQVSMTDVLRGTFKAVIFGAFIGCISCFFGFYVRGGATAVGLAVNRTVVYCVVSFLVLNYVLTTALFSVQL